MADEGTETAMPESAWAPEKPLDESSRWRSAAHSYGSPRVHFLSPDDAERTLCGKRLTDIGGGRAAADAPVTCKSCDTASVRRVEREQRRQAWVARIGAQEQERARALDERRAAYVAYLQTPEWRARRELVMQRAGRLCEGCRLEVATEVHHVTYEHLGNELLWELRAVCRGCHERIHEKGGMDQ